MLEVESSNPKQAKSYTHGRGQRGKGGRAPPPLDFHTWYRYGRKDLIVLFSAFFATFLSFFRCHPPTPPSGSPPLQHLRKYAVLPWRYDVEMAPQTSCTLRRNKASIMKGLVLAVFCGYTKEENEEVF